MSFLRRVIHIVYRWSLCCTIYYYMETEAFWDGCHSAEDIFNFKFTFLQMVVFRFKFHWNLFLMIQLTKSNIDSDNGAKPWSKHGMGYHKLNYNKRILAKSQSRYNNIHYGECIRKCRGQNNDNFVSTSMLGLCYVGLVHTCIRGAPSQYKHAIMREKHVWILPLFAVKWNENWSHCLFTD